MYHFRQHSLDEGVGAVIRSISVVCLALALFSVAAGAEQEKNVALQANGGAIVSATSEAGPNFAASNLINGVKGTDGWSSAPNATLPQEIIIDLAGDEPVLVSKVVFNVKTGYLSLIKFRLAKDVAVLLSATGTAEGDFSEVGRITLKPVEDDQALVLPEPREAKYVKIRILSSQSGGQAVELSEVEVYATEKPPAAPPAQPPKPAAPAAPAAPAQPPSEPTAPAEPSAPAAPAQPTTPAPPATPSEPAAPAAPSAPAQPSQPAEPTKPAQPTTPAAPAAPEQPSPPAEPTTPAAPTAPAQPTEPVTPPVPTPPSEPSAPAAPAEPAAPTAPATPAEPSAPAAPTTPPAPAEPAAPAAAEQPTEAKQLVNLALAENGGTIIASSFLDSTFSPSKLNDGIKGNESDGNGWASAPSPQYPQYLTVQFKDGRAYEVSKVVINSMTGAPDLFKTRWAKDIEIQISTTGKRDEDFETILTAQLEPTGEDQVFTFEPRLAKYVRIKINSNWGNSRFVEMGELEVWGDPGSARLTGVPFPEIPSELPRTEEGKIDIDKVIFQLEQLLKLLRDYKRSLPEGA